MISVYFYILYYQIYKNSQKRVFFEQLKLKKCKSWTTSEKISQKYLPKKKKLFITDNIYKPIPVVLSKADTR